MYAKIENGKVTQTTNNIRREFPNVSFPRELPDEHEGWFKVQEVTETVPADKQVASTGIEIVSGKPQRVYVLEDIPNSVKLDALASYRWQKVNGGIEVNGVPVQTDTEARANILGAQALGTSINWKTENGFVTLTAAQISGIATAIGQHVQKCFDAEKTVAENISNYSTPQEVKDAFDAEYAA